MLGCFNLYSVRSIWFIIGLVQGKIQFSLLSVLAFLLTVILREPLHVDLLQEGPDHGVHQGGEEQVGDGDPVLEGKDCVEKCK